jgi:hypothetical protein
MVGSSITSPHPSIPRTGCFIGQHDPGAALVLAEGQHLVVQDDHHRLWKASRVEIVSQFLVNARGIFHHWAHSLRFAPNPATKL